MSWLCTAWESVLKAGQSCIKGEGPRAFHTPGLSAEGHSENHTPGRREDSPPSGQRPSPRSPPALAPACTSAFHHEAHRAPRHASGAQPRGPSEESHNHRKGTRGASYTPGIKKTESACDGAGGLRAGPRHPPWPVTPGMWPGGNYPIQGPEHSWGDPESLDTSTGHGKQAQTVSLSPSFVPSAPSPCLRTLTRAPRSEMNKGTGRRVGTALACDAAPRRAVRASAYPSSLHPP